MPPSAWPGRASPVGNPENCGFWHFRLRSVLTAAAFVANATGLAGDASDRIIYETGTGNLFFDADGTGVGARVQFAVLNPGLSLTNTDFLVI